jgi:hypothetical protein
LSNNLFDLSGDVAVVTGAGRGIGTKVAARHMVTNGRIVNISSGAANSVVPGSGHYATAKAIDIERQIRADPVEVFGRVARSPQPDLHGACRVDKLLLDRSPQPRAMRIIVAGPPDRAISFPPSGCGKLIAAIRSVDRRSPECSYPCDRPGLPPTVR